MWEEKSSTVDEEVDTYPNEKQLLDDPREREEDCRDKHQADQQCAAEPGEPTGNKREAGKELQSQQRNPYRVPRHGKPGREKPALNGHIYQADSGLDAQ